MSRVVRMDGPALLFERVRGSEFPLAANVLGSARRCAWALGEEPHAIGERLLNTAERILPPRAAVLWESRRTLLAGRNFRIRRVRRAAWRTDPELTLHDLPVLTCWPDDGGPFLTFPLVLTAHPQTGSRNLGIYRMHVYDARTTGMHWQIMKGGGYHYAAAERGGRELPVAVALGADPITLLASVAPLPEGIDELAFAGFLRGAPTRVAECGSVDAWAPAEAEFVLEGVVPPRERRLEGPFGDHFGHYSHAAPFPVFHVRAIARRDRPVFPAAVVGVPPQEDVAMGEAVAGVVGPLIRLVHPEVRALHAYFEAGFHNLLVASVRQRYRKEGVKTALALCGQGQLALTKVAIVVDEDVPPEDWDSVLAAVRRHWRASEDILLLPGVPQDTLDFTSFTMNLGSKLILDCTRPAGGIAGDTRPEEDAGTDELPGGPSAPFRDPTGIHPRIVDWRGYADALLVARVRERDGRTGREVAEALAASPALGSYRWAAVVSDDVPLDDPTLLLWGVFTRFDAARDVVFSRARLDGAWPRYEGRMAIDATWKPGYPEPIVMDPDVVRRVDERWGEYGIS